VSIVIPTRNRAHFLPGAIETALAQEHVEVELVVVDDASTDATARMLTKLRDPRIGVVTHSTQAGVAAARNSGVQAASGTWIAFLDDDDLWSPHKISLQLRAAEADAADFVYGGAVIVTEKLKPLSFWRLPNPETLLEDLLKINAMPAGASNVVVRGEALRSIGPFDETLRHASDWDMWIRLAAALRGTCVPDVLTAYRLHSRGQHGDLGDEVLDELDIIEQKHGLLARSMGVTVDRSALESYVAKRRLQVAERRRMRARTRLREFSRHVARRVLRTPERVSSSVELQAPDWLVRARSSR
jgi:glycosyltransferase involved in cell wall biosynthesis